MFTYHHPHSFHIPVMGTGYTVDTPVKVAHLGISSVISIVDDMLIEKMREFYCREFDVPFKAISTSIDDFRAKRITAYLNLVNQIVNDKFTNLKRSVHETESDIKKYIDLLPDISDLKQSFNYFLKDHPIGEELLNWIEKNLIPGKIDVNIMTKVDKENYIKNEKLPVQFNDAHAALRGFALSDLESSVVFSAGMNPRLYGYIEYFDDFYPDSQGKLKKKIILKVSDYRSAMIQGKFLAKKGLWVSEYRIESGLNCGGHAFATPGILIGPILDEFRNSRSGLEEELNNILRAALKEKSRAIPSEPMNFTLSAQGGVGTSREHKFLMDYYGVDSVGWGTPFLLVDGVVNIDEETRKLLIDAREDDLYLSHISPLGVPFNNVKGNSKDIEKQRLISEGTPGSTCPKQLLIQSKEFTERPLCTASKQYQKLKLQDLAKISKVPGDYARRFKEITEKACLCLGLSDTAMKLAGFKKQTEKMAATICPGPNIAYFDKKISLEKMVDHIYGRDSVISRQDRPNMFLKELILYFNYFKDQFENTALSGSETELKQMETFKNNLLDGISYYRDLFIKYASRINDHDRNDLQELDLLEKEINSMTENVII
ncbi:MAG: hypothetical protein KFF73_18220 [Cyclobacteriaceae bacterium]|nr:hypothetical protein [Cyclobacteriaceae bacterium]